MNEPNDNQAQHVTRAEDAQEVYPLDDAAISLLADLRKSIDTLQAQWNGALVLFLRQHKLTGNWGVAENGRELVRRESAQ